jgi:hypothetical protein
VSRASTSARNRRATYLGRISQAEHAGSFRRHLWALVAWVMAEAIAAPSTEQRQLLADLRDIAEHLNDRRLK